MLRSFRELEVYQESYDLAIIIHKAIFRLPAFEKNDLGSQMRRASKSIPSNIAEGWAKRRFVKEFQHHLDIAIGSSNEMEVHLDFAKNLHYFPPDFTDPLIKRYGYLGGKLVNLRNSWTKK